MPVTSHGEYLTSFYKKSIHKCLCNTSLLCNPLLLDSLSFFLFLMFVRYDAIDDCCISNVRGNCINASFKSKVQVWQISVHLLETERQYKAIALDKKWEIYFFEQIVW